MLKYFEFLKENNNESILEMILESDVIYSDLFKKTISKINSPLAKALLDIENKDLSVRSNYFDINKDKNDIITFLPDSKAQQILNDDKKFVVYSGNNGGWLTFSKNDYGEYKNQEAFSMLGFTPPKELIKPQSNEVGEDIETISFDNKTYKLVKFKDKDLIINVDKLRSVPNPELEDNLWKKSRTEIKIGRAIRPLLKLANVDFLDKDIEEFVNLYKTTIDRLNDKFSFFKEVKEEEIKKWYSYKNYYNQEGTLGSSCMKNGRSNYFDIYSMNPDKCSLVILFSENDEEKITGRALLWTLEDGKRFLDRIYVNKDSDINLFREYALDNGWYHKRYNNSSESNSVTGVNGSTDIDLTIYVKDIDYDGYPYMDTLKFYDPNSGRLSYDQSDDDDYRLEETDGSHGNNCDTCGGSGNVSCYNCDGDGTIECSKCDGDGTLRCNKCEGEGEFECSKCEGEGSIEDEEGNSTECNDCEGSGKSSSCDRCEGEGNIVCNRCDGDERLTCQECDGNGEHSCGECNW